MWTLGQQIADGSRIDLLIENNEEITQRRYLLCSEADVRRRLTADADEDSTATIR
jgi:hypothetical protein